MQLAVTGKSSHQIMAVVTLCNYNMKCDVKAQQPFRICACLSTHSIRYRISSFLSTEISPHTDRSHRTSIIYYLSEDMTSPHLPDPQDFDDVNIIQVEKFPECLPVRPGAKKQYLGTLIRNNKFRIAVGLFCFLSMMTGAVGGAIFLSRTLQRINQGEAALSAASSSLPPNTAPIPLKSTMTQTMMATQTSVITGHITIPVSQLQSTIYAIATAPAGPKVTCESSDMGITCESLASRPEKNVDQLSRAVRVY